MSFDPKCYELAMHFLGEDAPEDALSSLAQEIQNHVEDWIEYDPKSPERKGAFR